MIKQYDEIELTLNFIEHNLCVTVISYFGKTGWPARKCLHFIGKMLYFYHCALRMRRAEGHPRPPAAD